MTRDADPAARRRLAVRGVFLATVIVLFTALIVRGVLERWRVSLASLAIAGGILLFLSAAETVSKFARPTLPPPTDTPRPAARDKMALDRMALTPLAVPVIVTPMGIVAILLFMGLAAGDLRLTIGVLALLILMMALNLVGMLAARPVVSGVRLATFEILGWIFSVLQPGWPSRSCLPPCAVHT
jgi:small neutral amino acid transporter SnatA (MarC family)